MRLILIGIGIALLLIASASFAFRENLVRFSLNPQMPYQTYVMPPAPDYSQSQYWAALPSDDAITVEDAALAGGEVWSGADVFFVHPTTYYNRSEWNGPVDDQPSRALLEGTVIPTIAGAFDKAGRLYAPAYRQGTLYSLLTHAQDGRLARQAAYGDVANAFAYYLREFRGDRPFFLVGYGQGGLHVIRLLQEFVAGQPLQTQLIAAYVIDHALPEDMFRVSLSPLRPCSAGDETGCVVSWIARPVGSDVYQITARSQVWTIFGRLVTTEGRPLTCINPLTWSNDELPAPNPLNLGGVALTPVGNMTAPVPEVSGAQCKDGILFVDRPNDQRFRKFPWPTTEYRVSDYNLFFANIEQNAVDRLTSWRQQKAESGSPKPQS